jgi:GAF domain-containing protein
VRWPGDELALVVLLAFTAAVAIALARLLRRQRLIERPLGVNP